MSSQQNLLYFCVVYHSVSNIYNLKYFDQSLGFQLLLLLKLELNMLQQDKRFTVCGFP